MPQKLGKIPYDELVQLMGNHNPKPSVTVQRFKFHSHFRKLGQSVANVVAELRQLSGQCWMTCSRTEWYATLIMMLFSNTEGDITVDLQESPGHITGNGNGC